MKCLVMGLRDIQMDFNFARRRLKTTQNRLARLKTTQN